MLISLLLGHLGDGSGCYSNLQAALLIKYRFLQIGLFQGAVALSVALLKFLHEL